MKNLIKAMIEVQKGIGHATKDAKNPHFKSDYAKLESVIDEIEPLASKNGIWFTQPCGKDAEGHYIETKIFHESGEELSSKLYLLIDKQNMQGLGSAITYARRYSLTALFGIGQEDDDGNLASKKPDMSLSPLPPFPPAIQPPVKPPQQMPPAGPTKINIGPNGKVTPMKFGPREVKK